MQRLCLLVFALFFACPLFALNFDREYEIMYGSSGYQPSKKTSYLYELDEEVSPKKNKLEIGLEYSDYVYREPHMDYPIKIAGKMQGIDLKYTIHSLMSEAWGENDNFMSVELLYMTGKVDYDGWLQDGSGNVVGPSSTTGIHDWYIDARLLFGRRVYLTENKLILDPFLGIAYRFLRDEQHKKSDSGYLRESNYLYVPIGADFTWQATSSFKLTLKGEFDWLLGGKQKSGMSRFDPAFRDMMNSQRKGFGARASIKAEQNIGQIGIFVEPFVRYWKIQNSKWNYYYVEDIGGGMGYFYGGIEPFNTTREYGLRAGVSF